MLPFHVQEVIVPDETASPLILPEVVMLPVSSIVKFELPFDWTSKTVPVTPDLVSLIIKAGAEPAFVKRNEEGVPESVV